MNTSLISSRRVRSILAAAAVGTFGSSARAVTQNSNWIGSTGSNWNTATNWSPAGVPNNGTNGFSDYNVSIGNATTALLDINATIDTLNISAGSQLTINPGLTLSIVGPTVTNNGTIQVDNNAQNANLNFAGTTSVSGTGTIFLFDNNPRPTINTSNGATVTFGSGQTIAGEGTVNASLVNNGTINANFSGQSIVLQTNAMTNNSLFEATGGATLSVSGITVTQGAAGQILAGTGSAVSISGSPIVGGKLNTASGSAIYLTNSTLTNGNIVSGSLVVLTPGTTANISGGTLVNNGTIQVDQNSQAANLNFTASTTVSGTGTIFLYDNNPRPTINTAAGAIVTFGSGQTITGEGTVNAALVNNGVINANVSGQSIVLQTNAMTNNNLFEATGGATLSISGITVTQTAGAQILAGTGAAVSISGATIVGGTLNTAAGSSIFLTSSTLTNPNIASGSLAVLTPGTTVNISGGTLVNNGTIQVDQNSQAANLNFTATTAVSGTGTIFLYDNNPRPTINTAAGAIVTFGSGQTITGEGTVNAALVNNGVINANVSGQSIVLQTNAMTNNNLFEATGGATLGISGITVTQATGSLILAGTGAAVSISGATINGGTINAASGGLINVAASTFNAVTIGTGTKVVVQPASVLSISGGTLVDNGLIQVDNFTSNAQINFTTNTTLSGTGTIFLDDSNPKPSVNTSAGATLTQSAGHTINGSGEIDATLTNNGLVNANFAGQTLILQTNAKTNNSLFEATGTGVLAVNGVVVAQSGAGQIAADNVSSISIYGGANVSGGTINASTGGSVTASTATFNNVTITAGTKVVVAAGTTLNISGGTLTNNGLIQVDTLASSADLNFTANNTIVGTGTIVLDDYSPNAKLTASAGVTVTQPAGHTISGVGEIDAALVNNGIVNANFGGQTLFLQTSPMTNNNLFEATGSGTLAVNGILVNQSSGAQIAADNVSSISIYGGANISGGTINASTGGAVRVSTATFNNVTISTGTTAVVTSGTTLNVSGGSLVNNGTIQVDQLSSNASLNFTAGTSVTGTGTIFLDDYSPNARLTAATGATVTFSSGQTIHGVGEIDPTVVNNGTINADFAGQTLFVNGAITNTGLLEANGGGTLALTGTTVTSGAGNTITAGSSGAVNISTLTATGTTITGAGPVTVTNGTFAGTTTNNGNLVIAGTTSGTGPLLGTGSTTINSGATFSATQIRQGALTVNGTATIPVVTPIVPSNTVGVIGTLTIGAAGTFDIGDSEIDITATSLATVNGYAARGFNGPTGGWTGTGLTSAAARNSTTHFTALGVIQNNQGGSPLFTAIRKFDGLTVGAADVLVRYTYYGDANLDGKVDGSDYSRIDNGFNNPTTATGWFNGDFNYDGKVDGSDYTLIDNVYNRQTSTLAPTALVATPTALAAGSAAVPEPATVSLLIAASVVPGRRRRQK